MSRGTPLYNIRPTPLDPGEGFRFLEVGQLIKTGDQYFTKAAKWVGATRIGGIVSVQARSHYRRAA